MSSTRDTTCSKPRIRRSRCASRARRGASCGAGSSAPRPAGRAPAGCSAASATWSKPTRTAKALIEALVAARILPADGWHQRVAEGTGLPGFESFLGLVRQQVLARATGADGGYGLEAEARPPIEGLVEAAGRLAAGLDRLAVALRATRRCSAAGSSTTRNPLDCRHRQRLDAAIRGLERRAHVQLGAWSRLLRDLGQSAGLESVEWLALDRFEGNENDIALNRNWIDPGIPSPSSSPSRRTASW